MHRTLGLGALVAFDQLTKVLAAKLLSDETRVDPSTAFQLVLNLNHVGLGTWVTPALSEASASEFAVAGTGSAALGVYLLFGPRLSRRGWSLWRRILVGVAAYAGGRVAGAVALVSVGGVSPLAGVVLTRTGGAVLFTALWWTARRGLWRVSTTLFAAAALGNLVSLVLPPHAIVDFMYSAIIKVVFRQEIFNFADLYYDAAIICSLAVPVQWLVRRFRTRAEQRTSGA
jgi:lipoprotein signal peptidase